MNIYTEVLSRLSESNKTGINPWTGAEPEFEYPPTYLNEDDGLEYCSNCHTSRQTRIDFPEKGSIVNCICNCIGEHYDQLDRQRHEQEEHERLSRMRHDAFHNPTALRWRFDADDHQGDEKSMQVMRNYAENFQKFYDKGAGLLIYGNVGVGKSFAAACIANALLDRGVPCLMTDFSRIINTLTGMIQGKQDYIDNLVSYDLLVIDDLGVQRNTPYANEIVTNVIDARVMSKKPLIVTTNLTTEELLGANDITYQRTLSRLFEHCIPIDFKGTDRRRYNGAKADPTLRGLLGL